MRAVNELCKGDSINQICLALTGDGPKDRKVLKAIADTYPRPNPKILWIPEVVSPYGRGNRRTGKYCGFSALGPIKMYVGKFKILNFLFIVDYEYVNHAKDLETQITEELRANGFNPSEVQQLSPQAFLIKCSDTAHEVIIRAVISGTNRRIEENEAALIYLNYGVNIPPDKDAIANFYRNNKTNVAELIKNSSRRNLSSAFADLVAAFDHIENSS
jgi:hypothetical protein